MDVLKLNPGDNETNRMTDSCNNRVHLYRVNLSYVLEDDKAKTTFAEVMVLALSPDAAINQARCSQDVSTYQSKVHTLHATATRVGLVIEGWGKQQF